MNALEIIKAYLKKEKYDGLCKDECGCWASDLAPCGEWIGGCVPGHETVEIIDDGPTHVIREGRKS